MIPEFGIRLAGIEYIDRPGVYAVIENDTDQIAVIEAASGFFLPGGGIDPGETELEALKRELMEETGYQISVIGELGTAVEYIEASSENAYCRIQSRFYRVELETKTGDGVERDQRLVWLPREKAIKGLRRQSQVWAVQGMQKDG